MTKCQLWSEYWNHSAPNVRVDPCGNGSGAGSSSISLTRVMAWGRGCGAGGSGSAKIGKQEIRNAASNRLHRLNDMHKASHHAGDSKSLLSIGATKYQPGCGQRNKPLATNS